MSGGGAVLCEGERNCVLRCQVSLQGRKRTGSVHTTRVIASIMEPRLLPLDFNGVCRGFWYFDNRNTATYTGKTGSVTMSGD